MVETKDDEDDVKVVLEQTLLKCDECFVYKVPPLATAKGHHAEDWNLAKPLETCSLHVLRRDESLYIRLMNKKPKPDGPKGATDDHLFAQAHVQISFEKPVQKMEHWVEVCVDTSRYFVIRISDERAGREAHIGMGFRERNDALNFKMSLQDYESALRRERKAEAIHMHHEERERALSEDGGEGEAAASESPPSPVASMSKLSFKEGEKIHIKLKNSGDRTKRSVTSNMLSGKVVGKGGLLLKKPPPAAPSDPSEDGIVVAGAELVKGADTSFTASETDSAAAVGSVDDLEDDDEEWGEFEGSSSKLDLDE